MINAAARRSRCHRCDDTSSAGMSQRVPSTPRPRTRPHSDRGSGQAKCRGMLSRGRSWRSRQCGCAHRVVGRCSPGACGRCWEHDELLRDASVVHARSDAAHDFQFAGGQFRRRAPSTGGGVARSGAPRVRRSGNCPRHAAGQAVAVAHVAAHELGAAAYAIKAVRAATSADERDEAGRQECAWQRAQLPNEIRELVLDDQRLRMSVLVPLRLLTGTKNRS